MMANPVTTAWVRAAVILGIAGIAGLRAQDPAPPPAAPPAPGPAPVASLEDTRLAMGKWIETQQIISRERKEWQQEKEILIGRLEVIRQESTTLAQKIEEAGAGVAEAAGKRAGLDAENDRLKAEGTRLAEAVTAMEAGVRKLHARLPDPVREKVRPLFQRIPEDPANTRVSIAERFQNVLGILNEINKANNEITVCHEVRELAGGKPTEVRVIYSGLAQAWYVSGGGQAGIGRPGDSGWTWESAPAIAADVLRAIEILEGKQTPAFVPLPVKLQ